MRSTILEDFIILRPGLAVLFLKDENFSELHRASHSPVRLVLLFHFVDKKTEA